MIDFATIVEDFFVALGGIHITLIMVIVPLLVAIPVGLAMAIVIVRRVPVVSQIARVYVSFMRGTPIIVQIFLIYNSLPALINVVIIALDIPVSIWDVNNLTYAITAFTASEIAILSEVFRAAINGIDDGQVEAAQCCGLTLVESYARIVIPQAFGVAIPVLGNATADLIKTTSLAFSMAVTDVMGLAKIEGAASSDYFDAYLAVFCVYLALVLVSEQVFKLLDRLFNAHTRPAREKRSTDHSNCLTEVHHA